MHIQTAETVFIGISSDRILSCGDVIISDNSGPPRVEWYVKSHNHVSSPLVPINDTEHWWKQFMSDQCKYGHGKFPKFIGLSSFDCTRNTALDTGVNIYSCKYSNVDIQPALYYCKIFNQLDNQDDLLVEKTILVQCKLQ